MKPAHKSALRVLLVLALIAILAGIFTPAQAKGFYPGPVVNNYYDDDDNGPSDGDVDALMAAGAIHCTTSTRKNQAGVGLGHRSGKNGAAAGYCKTIDKGGTPMMLGATVAGSQGRKVGIGVGLNWTF